MNKLSPLFALAIIAFTAGAGYALFYEDDRAALCAEIKRELESEYGEYQSDTKHYYDQLIELSEVAKEKCGVPPLHVEGAPIELSGEQISECQRAVGNLTWP